MKYNQKNVRPKGWVSSQELMDVLLSNGFRQVMELGGFLPVLDKRYHHGFIHYFRKNGDCRIAFLKDGRVHVLNGPTSRWELHEHLTTKELIRLMDFCALDSAGQDALRALYTKVVA
ncbi:MAG: hypothetical protein ACK4WD_07705 [Flavobacteriales bacterium]|jgi:hypothetical protein